MKPLKTTGPNGSSITKPAATGKLPKSLMPEEGSIASNAIKMAMFKAKPKEPQKSYAKLPDSVKPEKGSYADSVLKDALARNGYNKTTKAKPAGSLVDRINQQLAQNKVTSKKSK